VVSEHPLTRERALELVAAAEQAFADADVATIVDGYTDDVVIRFADLPEIRGKDAAAAFLRARFARQQDYRLTKRLRALDGDVIGNAWDGTWTDAQTGTKMRGFGTEFWTMRGEQIAVWEATFNVGEVGAEPSTPVL
jgi:uncharacterized protein